MEGEGARSREEGHRLSPLNSSSHLGGSEQSSTASGRQPLFIFSSLVTFVCVPLGKRDGVPCKNAYDAPNVY